MALRSADITVMAGAAIKAGRRLARDFGEVEQLQVSKKGPADFVSTADRKSEEIIVEELQRARPDFGFLVEEYGEIEGKSGSSRWLVDPLDGTTNFLHGIPHFAITIALEVHDRIQAGIIYQPLTDELFWAERGAGAYLNNRRLRVSARQVLAQSVVCTGVPHLGRGDHAEFLHILESMMGHVAGVRRFGAAALDLAYVAAGRFDGFWETHLSAWDIAAGTLLVREAGGMVSEFDGGSGMLESGEIVAANPALHPEMTKILSAARKSLPAG